MLKVQNVYKKYANKNILNDVNFCLNGGECICIAGSNGAGKSTILSIIAGALKPDKGEITNSEQSVIGYVPQDNVLFEQLSVRDNLKFWYAAYGLSKNDIFSNNSIESIMGLQIYEKNKVSILSGGIKKRLSIAIAMCHNPKYLVLDEPFNGLDIIYKIEIIDYLKLLKSMGIGVIFSSHSSYEIKNLCDKLLILKNGQAHFCEDIKDIFQNKNIDFDFYLIDKIKN